MEALQEVRKELKTRTTIEFNDLRKTIKSITFPDWDTMEITWNWGEKTCVPYQVDRAVDYPDPRDEDGWRKATPGATNFIQVEDAVEKLIQMVKQVRIIPDTSKRFEVPPMVYRDEAEMLRRMNGEKK